MGKEARLKQYVKSLQETGEYFDVYTEFSEDDVRTAAGMKLKPKNKIKGKKHGRRN